MKFIQNGIYIIGICALILVCQYLSETTGVFHYEENGKLQLYDLFYQILPDWHSSQWIINILPFVVFLYAVAQPKSSKILHASFLMFLIVLAIRALSIISTILPKHSECVVEGNPIVNFFKTGGGCYDKIFSGHTAFVTILTLNLLEYNYLNLLGFWTLNLLNMVTLLLTRAHYTVDVVLGFIISYLVFDGEYRLFGGPGW